MYVTDFLQVQQARNSAPAERARIRRDIQAMFDGNQVDVYVQSAEELVKLWAASLERQGYSREQIQQRFEELTGQALELGTAGFMFAKAHGATIVSTASDGKVLFALANDMRLSGNILGNYRITVHNGRQYIVFKGYPGLRKILTAPRYGLQNANILKMGIGINAAKGMVKSGVLVTVIFSVTLNGIEWLFKEEYGWTDFVGNVSADVVKAAIAGVAGYLTYAVFATTGTAVIPLGLGILVAVFAAYRLYVLDERHDLTQKLVDHISQTADYMAAVAKDPSGYVRRQVDEFVYYVVSEVGAVLVRVADRMLSRRLRQLERHILGAPGFF